MMVREEYDGNMKGSKSGIRNFKRILSDMTGLRRVYDSRTGRVYDGNTTASSKFPCNCLEFVYGPAMSIKIYICPCINIYCLYIVYYILSIYCLYVNAAGLKMLDINTLDNPPTSSDSSSLHMTIVSMT